jgi:four helix bundle protein
MASRNYADLIAWQKAMDLATEVYRVSSRMPTDERFGLVSQLRRSAAAIPANIAEGQGRRSRGAFCNHLSIAHGSIRELETHIQLAGRLDQIVDSDCAELLARTAEVGRLVTGPLNSLGP